MNVESVDIPEIKKPLHVGYLALNPDASIPFASTADSNGYDLCATDEVIIDAEQWKLVKCGFAVEIPSGHAMLILPKSGLSLKHGISVLNSPGLIDADYRGEIGVIVVNHNDGPYRFQKGDKLAQAIFIETKKVDFWPVDKLSETSRGEGGFGSTGK